MEDVLEVYHRPHDPNRPIVCLDETSKQSIAETRVPIAIVSLDVVWQRRSPFRFGVDQAVIAGRLTTGILLIAARPSRLM